MGNSKLFAVVGGSRINEVAMYWIPHTKSLQQLYDILSGIAHSSLQFSYLGVKSRLSFVCNFRSSSVMLM